MAYAQDEAFGRYFPDTLESLEALGADLVEFSPLRDERLPDGVDLVMIGCGHPDEHADLLASNMSMIAALREHVCRGRRIYSEGRWDRLPGTADAHRRPPPAGSRYFAIRRRAFARPETTGSRDARLAPRLLAGTRWDRCARLQERPLEFDSQRRAARMPHVLSARFRPRKTGFTTTTLSAVCSIFIWAPCRKWSTRSSDLTPRRCGVHRRAQDAEHKLETAVDCDDDLEATDL